MRKTLHNTYPLWSPLVTVMALVSICVFTMAGFVNKAAARDYVQQEVHGKYIQNTLVLSERVIEIKLLEQGYSDFVGYEVFHGLYKVRAKNKDGKNVTVLVNPVLGFAFGEQVISE